MSNLILRTPKRIQPPFNIGYGEYFFHKAEKNGEKIFQIDGVTEQIETYAQVKTRSTQVALGLQQLGVKPKDVVFICCYSGVDNIIPVFATLYLGGFVSSGDPRQNISDIIYLLDQVEPKIIFVEEKSVEMMEKALENINLHPQIIVIGHSNRYLTMKSMEKPYPEETSFSPVKQTDSDIAFIIFSSGTTSAQKGVYLSNKSALESSILPVEVGTMKPGIFLHFTSFYWITGILFSGACMLTDSSKVIGTDIAAERYLYLVDKYKITFSFSSNTFTHKLTDLDEETIKKYDTSSLSSFLIGGAIMQKSQLLKLRELLPHTKISMTYGSSETSTLTCFNLNDDEAYKTKILSSGTLVPGAELKVVDLVSGQVLGPNQVGEFRVKTPYLMSGYHKYNDPNVYDEDGFLKIGDLGFYDQDHYIYLTGRVKEMFKYQDFHILPQSIENVLLSHPAVKEVVAFGVPHLVDNNHPAAVVVLKPNNKIECNELIEFSNSKLADLRRLRGGIIILDEIPKTPSGKVQRRKAKEIFMKMKSIN